MEKESKLLYSFCFRNGGRMNMTVRNAMRNNRPDNCNTYCTSHSAVRVLNSNMTSRKSPRRNYFYEKHLLLLLATLLLMFVFAWVLSEKTNISQVKASSVEEPYKYYTSVQVKQGDSLCRWHQHAFGHMVIACSIISRSLRGDWEIRDILWKQCETNLRCSSYL